jgi:hypothetical protein
MQDMIEKGLPLHDFLIVKATALWGKTEYSRGKMQRIEELFFCHPQSQSF